LSLRNLPNVHIVTPDQLNTYDVLVSDDVVFTKDSLEALLAGRLSPRYSKDPSKDSSKGPSKGSSNESPKEASA
jgi:large subunit ribosomal protein L4